MYNKKDEHFNKLGPYATWPLDTTSMDERKNLRYPIIYKGNEIWPKKQWLWSKEKVEKAQRENKLVFNLNDKEGTYSIRFKGYLFDEDGNERRGKPLSVSIGPYTQEGTKDFEELFDERDIFPFPKPVSLAKQLINIFINGRLTNEDIFLDFFGGSGTTAQALLELNEDFGGNRKFIIVQLPELCDEESEAFKAGYKTISDIAKERIRRVIKKVEKGRKENKNLLSEIEENKSIDLGFKVFKLASSNFKIWRSNEITEENLDEQMDAFTNPIKEQSHNVNILYELMLKAGYPLTEKAEKEEKYYSINEGELIIVLEEMTPSLIDSIISLKPKKIMTLDILFADNDNLKTNTVLQMRDADIDFKTI